MGDIEIRKHFNMISPIFPIFPSTFVQLSLIRNQFMEWEPVKPNYCQNLEPRMHMLGFYSNVITFPPHNFPDEQFNILKREDVKTLRRKKTWKDITEI